MAKGKKTTVNLDVNAKGKGFKKIAVESKKAGQGLGQASKSASEFNRNMKGVTVQSSGASKNFSKMSQGMGGIVGAYATLAANIFAIGAAFRFLQDAGDLQKLKEGQVLYASATGIALRSLTNDIIAATDAQVTFANASQSAAIGKAAGMTNDQLVALGKGAKDVSIILGRDVTDSFNRLVRGVTKAEPELLDELGIILRLADATEKYGAMIGKSGDDLTQFEKSQAVTVEVLDQLETKYGRIMAVMEPSGNQFTQLGKAFDDIVNHIKEFSAVIIGPIAQTLTRMPMLIIGLLISMGNTLIKTGLTAWSDNAAASASALTEKYELARIKLERLQAQGTKSATALQGTAGITARMAKVAGKEGAIPAGFKSQAWQMAAAGKGDKLTSQQLVGMKAAVKSHATMSKKMKRQWKKVLNDMLVQTKLATKGIEDEFNTQAAKTELRWARLEKTWAGIMLSIKSKAAAAGRFMVKALGIISMISMAWTAGATIWQSLKNMGKAAEELDDPMEVAREKVAGLNEEFEKFNAVQKIIIEDGQGFLQFFQALGNRIGSLSLTMQEFILDEVRDEFAEFVQQSEEQIQALEDKIATKSSKTMSNLWFGWDVDETKENIIELQNMLDHLESGAAGFGMKNIPKWMGGTGADLFTSASWMDFVPAGWGGNLGAGKEGLGRENKIEELKEQIEMLNQALLAGEGAWEAYGGNILKYMSDINLHGEEAFVDFATHISGIQEAAKLGAKAFGPDAVNPVTNFVKVLDKLKDITPEMLKDNSKAWTDLKTEIFAAESAATAFSTAIANSQRMMIDNRQEADKLLLDTQARSTEGRMVDNLKLEIEERNKVMAAGLQAPAGMEGEERTAWIERAGHIEKELVLFQRIDEMKDQAKKRTLETANAEKAAMIGTTKLVAARLKAQFAQLKNDNKILEVRDKMRAIEEKMEITGKTEPQQLRALRNHELELEMLRLKNIELERSLDWNKQIADAAAQALETGLEKAIKGFLKGEERSLRDAMKVIAEAIIGAVIDVMAKRAAAWIMGFVPGRAEGEEIRRLMKLGGTDAGTTIYNSMMRAGNQLGMTGQPTTWAQALGITPIPKVEAEKDKCIRLCNEGERSEEAAAAQEVSTAIETKLAPALDNVTEALEENSAAIIDGPRGSGEPDRLRDIGDYGTEGLIFNIEPGTDKLEEVMKLAAETSEWQGREYISLGGLIMGAIDQAKRETSRGTNISATYDDLNTPWIQFQKAIADGTLEAMSLKPGGGSETRRREPAAVNAGKFLSDLAQGRFGPDISGWQGMNKKTPVQTEEEKSFFARLTEGVSGIWEALFGKKTEGAAMAETAGGVGGDMRTKSTPVSAASARGGIFGPVISVFENLFGDSSSPFLARLGDFFSGDGSFLNSLGGIVSGLGDMLARMFQSPNAGSTGSGGGWMQMLQMAMSFMANGGIVKGGFRKYAKGGIATSPTLGLIGEGRHNEAIVPLPNGKAIPVDMRSSAQNNNITVNVSSDGHQTQTSGNDGEQLGNAIARAVQEELQNQKRAGGILNRYGTA